MPRTRFQLAHLSDPHLPFDPDLVGQQRERFTIKQRLALLSWQRKRRRISTMLPDAALRRDLASMKPDHVAVTGDAVNVGLPTEYGKARDWLNGLGDSTFVSLVPGNHDLTAHGPAINGLALWRDHISGDDGEDFPFLRVRDGVALLGLCSGVPTRPGSAAGRLGHRQIAQTARLLGRARGERLFRVVLIHHPPALGPGGPRKALRDRGAFARMLRRHGAELVLHGHHHRTSLTHLDGPGGPIPVFGVPACLAAVPKPELAGWMSHLIEPDETGWALRTTLRRYDPASDRFAPAAAWRHRLLRS